MPVVRPSSVSLLVRAKVNDIAVRATNEEPHHASVLCGQRMDDVETVRLRPEQAASKSSTLSESTGPPHSVGDELDMGSRLRRGNTDHQLRLDSSLPRPVNSRSCLYCLKLKLAFAREISVQKLSHLFVSERFNIFNRGIVETHRRAIAPTQSISHHPSIVLITDIHVSVGD